MKWYKYEELQPPLFKKVLVFSVNYHKFRVYRLEPNEDDENLRSEWVSEYGIGKIPHPEDRWFEFPPLDFVKTVRYT